MIYNYTACIIKSPPVNESCKWIDSDLCWSGIIFAKERTVFSRKKNRAFSNFLHSFGVVKQWDSVSLLRRPLCRSDQSSWWFCVHACNECVHVLPKGGIGNFSQPQPQPIEKSPVTGIQNYDTAFFFQYIRTSVLCEKIFRIKIRSTTCWDWCGRFCLWEMLLMGRNPAITSWGW